MGKFLGASWLTSVFGGLGIFFEALAKLDVLPVGWNGWATFIAVTLLGGGLIAAKSYNVTNAPKPAEAATAVEEKDAKEPSVPVRTIAP